MVLLKYKKEFKNTTNDELAIMIARGFEGVDMRFDKIEAFHFGDYKKRLEKLEFEMKELKNVLILK